MRHPQSARRRWAAAVILILAALAAPANGQERGEPGWLLPMPEIDADPAIPTLEEVVGHSWGADISSHAEVLRYLEALAKAAPDRCRLVRYGQSVEGRDLVYLVLSAPETIARLDEARADNLLLADPRALGPDEAETLIDRAPAVLWLAYAVHGDESSSSDAALITAYTLLADRREETRIWLNELIVVIDPIQNPDGRDRFVGAHRRARGAFPQSSPRATERLQPWPGGRYNHYLFDLNRDWFLQSQPETRAKVAAYLDWQPQVYVDVHEMGANASYYFDPASDPFNPQITPRQNAWATRIGRLQAEQFDRFGFSYTSREIFDAFYPGYGSTWPMMHGAIGLLWEQAGVRGLVVDRDDGQPLHYHDAVRHHYVSGLAAVQAAASGRADLLRTFHEGRGEAIERGRSGDAPDVFLLPGKTPVRAAELAELLVANGIEVRRLTAAAVLRPEGSAVEQGAQPASEKAPSRQTSTTSTGLRKSASGSRPASEAGSSEAVVTATRVFMPVSRIRRSRAPPSPSGSCRSRIR
ncbi:hypothetical protein TsocGM_22750 [Tautonia sociabilis]|uniref:Peptidase M14 domain-containing protein n=1 Tax=Tautonia sociabilis TaxID=2080755 RepID=A0A432MDU3_9BACT|nr:M14 family zinc carboxypeptidase [Tautonia sociabilis]RUL83111.1 hypothetical protein TsocGM_22750 [Tautonia sociabilis]